MGVCCFYERQPGTSIDSSNANWGIARLQKQFRCNKSSIRFFQVQKQIGGCDCGLFAIANAFTVTLNGNPNDQGQHLQYRLI